MKNKKLVAIIILVIVLIIGAYQFMTNDADTRKIKSNSVQGVAQVTNYSIDAKTKQLKLGYAFSRGTTTYMGTMDYDNLSVSGDEMTDRYFPVIYFDEDPGVSRMLITEQNFKQFDLEQPDSLKKYNSLKK